MSENIKIVVAALIGVALGFFIQIPGGMTTTSLDKNKIGDIINKELLQGKVKAEIGGISDTQKVSKVEITIQGQKDSLYVSENGEKFFQKVLDLEEIKKQKAEMEKRQKVQTKSDKPKVELFVMSYCPYGTQTEKGYLPAVKKLGDKIDAKVKFVNYVMHPSKGEGEENLLQYCIEETTPSKFNDYLTCFLDKGDTAGCLAKNGLDKNSGNLRACIDETDKKFKVSENLKDKTKWLNGRFPKFNIQNDLNEKYDVKGSPTLVINGQVVETGRDANSIFKTICSAFKVQPEVCKEELDSTAPAPGFGYDGAAAAGSDAASCGA